jgi:predicted nucleic acid-binding Zn ribbon protein
MTWGVLLEYMPKPSVTEVKAQIDTHEAVCSERWKETILRIKRIETIMIGTAGTIIILLVGLIVR